MDDLYGEDRQDSDDPAEAFERLRGEIALLRRAVEGLTAERQSIDIPDYEPTLARTEKILGLLARQIDAIGKSPAMTLTAENMGSRLNASVLEAVNAVRGQAQASKSALDGAISDLRGLGASARRADEQKQWLTIIGGGGVLLGLLLYALLAGPIARMMPASWQWPERMAARLLDEPTTWEAGQHLMARSSRPSWETIVAAASLERDNREAIERCRKTAARTKKAVRCAIDVKARQDTRF